MDNLTFNQVVRGSNPRTLRRRDIGTQILKGMCVFFLHGYLILTHIRRN